MKRFLTLLRWPALLGLLLVGALVPARAGGSADCKTGVDRYGDTAIRNFALKLNDALDQRKVNVAIIARCGRPRASLPRGISYTHVAFAVFEPVRAPDGAVYYAYTVYNLYQQGKGRSDRSYLKQDLTYDFVAGVAEPDVAVCVPTPELQQRILQVIRSPAYRSLYNPQYNLVANPWVDRYDNCVTHCLKVCVAALYQTDDRQRIYDDIRAYFRPSKVRLDPLQSLGSSFLPEISREDMDRSGLQTATYDSLKAFLESNRLTQESFTVALN